MMFRSARALVLLLLLPVPAAAADEIQWLFIQTAQTGRFDGQSLILEGLSPTTTAFSDRPHRLVRHTGVEDFLALWGDGPDSFAVDAPNAGISAVTPDGIVDAVVELSNPRYEEGRLSYDVVVLEGTLPTSAPNGISVFIDPTPTTVDPMITE